MSRKRLGDLLREEAGKPTPEPTPPTTAAKPPARKPAAKPASPSSPEPNPESMASTPVTSSDAQLQAQLAELQAQLQAQSAHLQDLEAAQQRSQSLETELATAKKTILQLTDINQSLAAEPKSSPPGSVSIPTQPAVTPTKPKPTAAPSVPATPPVPAKHLVEHPALHLRPLEPPQEKKSSGLGSPAAQAYRFERIGWKPLANHLVTSEQPHKLSDEDLGWVD